MAKEDEKRWLLAKNRGKGKGKNKDGGELLASDSSPLPIKRQRIPRMMPVQIVDADWGTSQSRLRHQLQDESPLFPEGLSSESSGFPEGLSAESSDTVQEVESDTVEEDESDTTLPRGPLVESDTVE